MEIVSVFKYNTLSHLMKFIEQMQESYMQQALDEARRAFARQEVPVGAVIYDSQQKTIIASSGNTVEALCSPVAHAEINVLQQASKLKRSSRLNECDIYVTLEPCPMCAYAISLARIRRVYFAAYDPKGGGVEHGPKIFNSPSCHHVPQVYGGICEDEAAQLLKSFFQARR